MRLTFPPSCFGRSSETASLAKSVAAPGCAPGPPRQSSPPPVSPSVVSGTVVVDGAVVEGVTGVVVEGVTGIVV
jgi:hypothetical protein